MTVGELLEILKDEPEDCQIAIPYSTVECRTSDEGRLMLESPLILSRIWQPKSGSDHGEITLIVLSGQNLPELAHRVVQGDAEMPN